MGVTVHFFAFDPKAYSALPHLKFLIEMGDLDRELQVQPQAKQRLKEIQSHLGDNKRWYDNLVGDDAYEHARPFLPAENRAALDRWLGHLFYQQPSCDCGLNPVSVADAEVVYSPELLQHLIDTEADFGACTDELEQAFAPKVIASHWRRKEYIFSADGLEHLRYAWASLIYHAHKAGPQWALLQWVWY